MKIIYVAIPFNDETVQLAKHCFAHINRSYLFTGDDNLDDKSYVTKPFGSFLLNGISRNTHLVQTSNDVEQLDISVKRRLESLVNFNGVCAIPVSYQDDSVLEHLGKLDNIFIVKEPINDLIAADLIEGHLDKVLRNVKHHIAGKISKVDIDKNYLISTELDSLKYGKAKVQLLNVLLDEVEVVLTELEFIPGFICQIRDMTSFNEEIANYQKIMGTPSWTAQSGVMVVKYYNYNKSIGSLKSIELNALKTFAGAK